MTLALTLNGEANFEWQPAAKATTQLITHVTSKYGREREGERKKSLALPPTPPKALWVDIRATKERCCRHSVNGSMMMAFYTFLIVTCNFEFFTADNEQGRHTKS